ncbi:uncharacterized protein [Palaemon carinicauda]|uniref:uncharacterized protein n=1 Tax=Palaemon carinicauda TaxID=392227 RepID=UPI0035B5ECF3
MMTSADPPSCGICSEVFNKEERCPRDLPCSHHLCTTCIRQLIAQDSNACPFCRESFEAKDEEQFMINQAFLDSSKIVIPSKKKPYKRCTKMSSAYQQRLIDFKEDVYNTNKEVMKDVRDIKNDIGRLLKGELELQNELHARKNYFSEDVFAQIQKILSKIEENHKKSVDVCLKLRKSLKDVGKNEEKLVSARGLLDSANTLQDASAVIDETEEISMVVSEWTHSIKEYISKEDCQLQERNKELQVLERYGKNLMKSLMYQPEEEACHLSPITGVSVSEMDLSSQVTALGLWEMRTPVKLLVEQGRVFALQVSNDKRRSARISIENGKLHLYSLQDEETPIPKAYYVEYEDVHNLARCPCTVFLDLKKKGLLVGRVHIVLDSNGKSCNMHLQFTGANGQSYSNTPLQVSNKGQLWEKVVCGYEMSEAVSGNTDHHSLTSNNGMQNESGAVWLLDHGRTPPLIGIHTGPFQPHSGSPLGFVEEDLSVLSDVVYWSDDMKDVMISQCGLVLPTK